MLRAWEREYVVGFPFTMCNSHVLLLQKTHPEWQAGKLNGPGGKVEPDESPEDCVRREVWEETGLDVDDWELFARLISGRSCIWFYRAFIPTPTFNRWGKRTEETPTAIPVEDLGKIHNDLIPNLNWLIQMALSMDLEQCDWFEIIERPGVYPEEALHE